MNERYSGPFAWLRSWNHQRIQKRRWLRNQGASRTAAPIVQPIRATETCEAAQAPSRASDPLHSMPVPTKRSSLARLRLAGVVIDTVVDVGVQEGTPELIAAFPHARHLLFEPLASMNSCIEKAYAGVLHELHNVACFSDDGQSYLVGTCIDGSGRVTHTHVADTPDAPGIGEVVNCQPIRRVRLDSMDLKLGAHVLLKVDVDGVDLEVLKGATELLARTEVVIVEAPLSRLLERCDFLIAHGFQFYDIVDLCYYHSILHQVDVVFVRADVFKRHPELDPWANKVFSWDGYQQLSVQLDLRGRLDGYTTRINTAALKLDLLTETRPMNIDAIKAAILQPSFRLANYQAAKTKIDGFFNDSSAALFDIFLQMQQHIYVQGDMLEIGVYKGRSAAISMQYLSASERFFLIDYTDHLDDAKSNLQSHLGVRGVFHKHKSGLMTPDSIGARIGSVRWIHIDGGHTGNEVVTDIELCEKLLSENGVMVLDDFFNPMYPQLTEAVYAYLASNKFKLTMFLVAYNKAYLSRPGSAWCYRSLIKTGLADCLRVRGVNDFLVCKTTPTEESACYGIGHRFVDRDYYGLDSDPDVML